MSREGVSVFTSVHNECFLPSACWHCGSLLAKPGGRPLPCKKLNKWLSVCMSRQCRRNGETFCGAAPQLFFFCVVVSVPSRFKELTHSKKIKHAPLSLFESRHAESICFWIPASEISASSLILWKWMEETMSCFSVFNAATLYQWQVLCYTEITHSCPNHGKLNKHPAKRRIVETDCILHLPQCSSIQSLIIPPCLVFRLHIFHIPAFCPKPRLWLHRWPHSDIIWVILSDLRKLPQSQRRTSGMHRSTFFLSIQIPVSAGCLCPFLSSFNQLGSLDRKATWGQVPETLNIIITVTENLNIMWISHVMDNTWSTAPMHPSVEFPFLNLKNPAKQHERLMSHRSVMINMHELQWPPPPNSCLGL